MKPLVLPDTTDSRFADKLRDPEYARQAARSWRRHALALKIEAIKEMREWQPIETAPKDGTLVDLWLLGFPHPKFPEAVTPCRRTDCSFDRGRWRDNMGGSDYLQAATHWMPLPEPPEK